MIVTVNPVNFPDQKILEIIVSTVSFLPDRIEHLSRYLVEEKSKLNIPENVYKDFYYVVKRSALMGVFRDYNQEYDKWKVTIYTTAWRDLELFFETEREGTDFSEQARSYIFDTMKCIT